MTWVKLDNPKPCTGLGREAVRVVARGGPRGSRTIFVKVGPDVARRGSFTRPDHKCHVLLGGGEDAGQLAIALDDSLGKFKAKRRADGRYEIAVSGTAAAGRFALIFAAFERPATFVPNGNGPPFIRFEVPREFLVEDGK